MPNVLDRTIAVVTNDSAERLAKRRTIRKQIAQRKQLEQRAAAISERLKSLDDEADTAADIHREHTQPAQATLDKLDDQVIELAADRKPISKSLEAERRKLLEVIHLANDELAKSIASIDARRQPLQKELAKLQFEIAQGSHLEFALSRPGIANPDLAIKRFVNEQATRFATARVDSARRRLDAIRVDIDLIKEGQRSGDITERESHRASWQAELNAAEACAAALSRELDELYRDMIDE